MQWFSNCKLWPWRWVQDHSHLVYLHCELWLLFSLVTTSPSMLHSRVLGDQTQLKEELETLKRDNAQLVREHNHLKQNCEELKRLHSQDQKELADLQLQQQQVHTTHIMDSSLFVAAIYHYYTHNIKISSFHWLFSYVARVFTSNNVKKHVLCCENLALNSTRRLWLVFYYSKVLSHAAPMGTLL